MICIKLYLYGIESINFVFVMVFTSHMTEWKITWYTVAMIRVSNIESVESPKDILIIHLHFLDLIQSVVTHTPRFRKQWILIFWKYK